MKRQVICINWGTKYGPPYINRLYAMVERNISRPFTFTCFTDNDAGIRPEVRCEPLPPLEVEMPKNTFGIWPKARLWGDTLGDLTGPVLYLDLDVVVTGSLDEFFTVGEPGDVILARNPTLPFQRVGQTSVFRFPVGKLAPLQAAFKADPQGIADRYRFEQRLVSRRAPGGIKFFPRSWVRHFRRDCVRTFPLNYWLEPRLPPDARVVIFPGGLKPSEAAAGVWRSTHARKTRAEHLAETFTTKRKQSLSRHLRHYMLPTSWIADHWRE